MEKLRLGSKEQRWYNFNMGTISEGWKGVCTIIENLILKLFKMKS